MRQIERIEQGRFLAHRGPWRVSVVKVIGGRERRNLREALARLVDDATRLVNCDGTATRQFAPKKT